MTYTTATTTDLAQTYDDATDAIIDLLDALRRDLADHNRDFAKTASRDWTYPGDLNHVRDLLQQAHDFLASNVNA